MNFAKNAFFKKLLLYQKFNKSSVLQGCAKLTQEVDLHPAQIESGVSFIHHEGQLPLSQVTLYKKKKKKKDCCLICWIKSK